MAAILGTILVIFIFAYEKSCNLIQFQLKFVQKCPIYMELYLLQIKDWRLMGDMSSYEPTIAHLCGAMC